jgi:hypothetical protein
MSIFLICIIASNVRLAAVVSESVIACVRTIGAICQDIPQLSLHQPHFSQIAWQIEKHRFVMAAGEIYGRPVIV